MNPVTLESNPAAIIVAFHDSGYWEQLTESQQRQSIADPRAWLDGHPYLFSWFPSYFYHPRLSKVPMNVAKAESIRKPRWKFW